jgi:peptidoglycan hydrolase CwlO-like protein
MRNFLQKISSVLSVGGESFDTILHLGAGQDAELSDYASLQFKKLILVEGDPEAAEVLSNAYEGDPSVQVISKLVSPAGGDVTFHRYNLSSVNGIFPAGRLTTLYPRLRLIGEEVLHTISLSSLIEGIQIDNESKNLLILDLPGQEADLIQTLSREQLRKFRFIVIRGCRKAYQEGAKELSATLSLLGRSHYKLVDQDAEENPQWPIALFEFDGAIAEIEEELEKRARLLVEKATQIHQQGERIGELERALGEASAHRDGLQGEVAEATQQREELQNVFASQQEELENRARLLVEKATQIHQQGERIAELERVLGEVSAHRDGLQGEVAEVTRQRDELQSAQAILNEELENRARLLLEKATQIHQQGERIAELERVLGEASALQTSLQTQVSDLSAAVSSKETLLDVLSKGRVQQDRMYEELGEERDGLLKRIETLESRAHSLEQQIQERDGKSLLVDAEFQKVEGQMEIIKEIFLRGKSLK